MTAPHSAAPGAAAPLRTTPLHSRHLALGAKMSPFGGWEMPLWYASGAVKEHLAVITAAGLFDTSHMDLVLLAGPGNKKLLDYAFTRDLANPRPGRAVYGVFLDGNGHSIDDAIVYPMDDGRFAVVVNAGMGPVVVQHLKSLPPAAGAAVVEASPRAGKLDLQGPASAAILRDLLADPAVLDSFPFFSFKGDFDFAGSSVRLKDGTPLLLSRTGYTGELGFEMFMPADRVGQVWDDLLRAGSERGIAPCGLAARDSLRVGAVLPLSHQDIGPWPFINNPWSFALPFAQHGNGFTKPFVGDEALLAGDHPHTLPFLGFDPRRVDPEKGKVIHRGDEVGTILTIVSDMAIGRADGKVLCVSSPDRPEGWTPRGLACGFVKINRHLDPGETIHLRDDRREIQAEIVSDIRPNRSARAKITR